MTTRDVAIVDEIVDHFNQLMFGVCLGFFPRTIHERSFCTVYAEKFLSAAIVCSTDDLCHSLLQFAVGYVRVKS